MCQIIQSFNKTQFTGYKLAEKRDDGYYSICTGTKYEIGNVPVLNYDELSRPRNYRDTALWNGYIHFSYSYSGYTGVFETKELVYREYAIYIKDYKDPSSAGLSQTIDSNRRLCILKLTLKKDLKKCRSPRGSSLVIAGKRITKITKVEEV